MSDDVVQYLEQLVPERPAEMQRMEVHARATSFPIIGPAAGWFCYVMARMIGARSVCSSWLGVRLLERSIGRQLPRTRNPLIDPRLVVSWSVIAAATYSCAGSADWYSNGRTV